MHTRQHQHEPCLFTAVDITRSFLGYNIYSILSLLLRSLYDHCLFCAGMLEAMAMIATLFHIAQGKMRLEILGDTHVEQSMMQNADKMSGLRASKA